MKPLNHIAGMREGCRGLSPLDGRIEDWQLDLLSDPEPIIDALGDGSAPVNIVNPDPIERNGGELIAASEAVDIELRVFFARKANKCIAFVDKALTLGYGVDVASHAELNEVLERGLKGDRIVVTAAIKPKPLLDLAISSAATIVLDNPDELSSLEAALNTNPGARSVPLAIRLAPEIPGRTPTRFGVPAGEAVQIADRIGELKGADLAGIHFHLDGYSASERAAAIAQSLSVMDACQFAPETTPFLDIGGGIPMSYLDDGGQWEDFWAAQRAAVAGSQEALTFENHGLGLRQGPAKIEGSPSVYPYFQEPTRGDWLSGLLGTEIDVAGRVQVVSDAVRERHIELRCEPGRSLLDGCGVTAARVHYVKQRQDGEALIGLGMNRTQCRSTSDDFLIDPILLPTGSVNRPGPLQGYLVGAYCIERELITLRKMNFPDGVSVGDIVVLPNTAGYLMHILESSSHRMPLAPNFVYQDGTLVPDLIDSAFNQPNHG